MRQSTFWARELRSRPGRAILTVLSIVIGVAAVVSVALATATTRNAHEEMYRAFSGKAALEIASVSGEAFDAALLEPVRQIKGVQAIVPSFEKITKLRLNKESQGIIVVGIDPALDSQIREFKLESGELFRNNNEDVLIPTDIARRWGVNIGDQLSIYAGQSKPIKVTIVGLVSAQGAAAFNKAAVLLHLKSAQQLWKLPGKVHSAQLRLTDGANTADIRRQIEAVLPAGQIDVDKETKKTTSIPKLIVREPTQRPHMTEETLLQTRQGLNLASALSLVVAVFIIVNAFLMNVSERRRQLAIMRAIGATRKQVITMLMTEGLVLGIIGTVIGTALGVGGAYWLTRAMEQLFQSSLPSMRITATPFILGAFFGLLISLVSVYVPARKAGLISPLEGMARVAKEDLEGAPRWTTYLGLSMFAASAVLMLLTIYGVTHLDYAILAAVGGMSGIAFLLPAVLEPTSRGVAKIFYRLLGIEGQLAQRQLVRRRTRTSLTIAVLFVAISTGIGLGTTILNNTDDVRTWFNRTVAGDFFVRALMPDMTEGLATQVPESLRGEIEAIDGVAEITSVRLVRTRVKDNPALIVAKDFSATDILALDLKDGKKSIIREELLAGDVVIGTVLAQRTGLKAGDTIELETDAGIKAFRVAATANEYMVGGLALYMHRQTARDRMNVDGTDVFIVQAKPDRFDAVEAALAVITDSQGLLLQSQATLRRFVDDMMAGVVGGLWVLLALGMVVAAFGIANTLTMNVLEQTRELGLLRVVAMTRKQVRKTVLSQAMIMGLIGLVPGVLVGTLLAYLINYTTNPVFGHGVEFTIRPALLAICFLAAYAIVVATALIPAERAARLELTTAMHYE